jgi:methyl-accepting chemotaxis protein
MLNNLKIGVRLALSFGVIAVVFVFVIIYSNSELTGIKDDVELLVKDRFPKTQWANTMIIKLNEGARALRNIILTDDPSVQREQLNEIEKANSSIGANLDSLTKTVTDERGRELMSKLSESRAEYVKTRKEVTDKIDVGDKENAVAILFTSLQTSLDNYIAAINNIIDYEDKLVKTAGVETGENVSSAINLMIILGVITIAFTLFIAFFITRSITVPVKAVMFVTEEIQKGHIKIRTDINTKDELGNMAKALNHFVVQLDQGIVGSMERIAGGDVAFDVPSSDNDDLISPVINKMIFTIREMTEESKKLVDAAVAGQLDARGNAERFQGSYREIISGLNNTLNAFTEPIKEQSVILQKIGDGDLTAKMIGDYKGDFGIIKNSINQLSDSLNGLIGEVSQAVQATASAATQISSSTEEMASGSQEQSSQAAEVATAVEQMTTTILQTSKSSNQAAENAKIAGHTAQEGSKAVNDTINGMNSIAEVVSRAAQTVQELGQNSDKIGEIVQVIDDIADQTNLLALNAAIEAARAGEQGRGFAVVADEVRKLAERTTKATKEIASMIKQIQRDTDNAVESMKIGTNEVIAGKELAEKSGTALRQIVKNVDQVIDMISQVASASEEQSSAAEQIGKNIEIISSVSNESAAGTQQIARAAEDLNRLVDGLQKTVDKFKSSSDSNEDHARYAVRKNGKLVHV